MNKNIQKEFSQYQGIGDIDSLEGWSKKQLIYEVLRLRLELETARVNFNKSTANFDRLNDMYLGLIAENSRRLDRLMGISSASGDNVKATHKPIHQARAPWPKVAAQFEARDRKEYWDARIKDLESETGVMNSSSNEKLEEKAK